ncbi:MAG: hypothetical protein ACLQD8_07330 [Thermoplasmata archaeon]
MWLNLLGQILRAIARFRPDEEGLELDHVGEELIRLDRGPAQRPATSR